METRPFSWSRLCFPPLVLTEVEEFLTLFIYSLAECQLRNHYYNKYGVCRADNT